MNMRCLMASLLLVIAVKCQVNEESVQTVRQEITEATYFPLETDSNSVCFLMKLPEDRSKMKLADATAKELDNYIAQLQVKDFGKYPKGLEKVPECKNPSPCVRRIFDYRLPDNIHKEGLNIASAYTYKMQKFFITNYPKACKECGELLKFEPKIPVVIEELDRFNWIQCAPVFEFKNYKMSKSLFEKVSSDVEAVVKQVKTTYLAGNSIVHEDL
ncbi:hypothetical protein M3Y97_00763100 [Aphelenchoides bicaudatus]|nr:hypothetical protein M3Y97_00763100 [Aphelenchoides bicaudatus]